MATYVYRATSARANPEVTRRLAQTRNLLVRSVHDVSGRRIANVQHLRPGDLILLVHSDEPGADVLLATILSPNQPHHAAPAIDVMEGDEAREIAGQGYELIDDQQLAVIRLERIEIIPRPANLPRLHRNTLTPCGENFVPLAV